MLQALAPSRRSVIRHLGRLMHLPANSVANELSDYRETLSFGPLLNSRSDIGKALARKHFSHTLVEGIPRRFQQLSGFLGDGADGNGHGRIAMKAPALDPKIKADYVTLLEFSRPRDPVDDLLVDGDAQITAG